MLIKEYRIPLPLTVEEYRIAQLYMIAKKSETESKGEGSGVEIIINEPYTDGPGGNGQYTKKIYHVGSHLPGWIKGILPKSALIVEEEAWNAYPYTRTRYTCPFVEKFSLDIETYYYPDDGHQNNVFNLAPVDLRNRSVDVIDIVRDQLYGSDYEESEDPTLFVSTKTGRGVLGEDWLEEYWNDVQDKEQPTEDNKALMCAYKICRVEFRYWGMQTKLEKFIHDVALRKTMLRAHRQAWAWQDEWWGLTIEEIREYELRTQKYLARKMAGGSDDENTDNADTLRNDDADNDNTDDSKTLVAKIFKPNEDAADKPSTSKQAATKKTTNAKDTDDEAEKGKKKQVDDNKKRRSRSQSIQMTKAKSGTKHDQHSPNGSAHSFDAQVANWRLERLGVDSKSNSEEEYFDCIESNYPTKNWTSMDYLATSDNLEVCPLVHDEATRRRQNDSIFDQEYLTRVASERGNKRQALRQASNENSPPASPETPTCSTTILILAMHAGSVLDPVSDLTAQKSDVQTFRNVFENTMHQYYPSLSEHILTKLVPCPSICTEALGILSSLSPYSFDSTPLSVDIPNTADIPIGAIPLLSVTSPEYQENVNKFITTANTVYRDFLKSEDGLNFNGQVVLIGDSMGSLLAYEALCRGCNTPNNGGGGGGGGVSTAGGSASSMSIGGSTSATTVIAAPVATVCGSVGSGSGSGSGNGSCSAIGDNGSRSSRTDDDDRSIDTDVDCKNLLNPPSPAHRRSSSISAVQQIKLDFEVSDFFMFGSPLSIVLAARKLHDPKASLLRPHCNQIYNLFHPTDPTAARLEPLLSARFSLLAPVNVPRYAKYPLGNGQSLHLLEVIQSNPQHFNDSNNALAARRTSDASMQSTTSGFVENIPLNTIHSIQTKWWGTKRLDYALYCPEGLGNFPSHALPHLFHASYWESSDVIAFVLRQIGKFDNVPYASHVTDKDIPNDFNPGQPREKWIKKRTSVKLKNVAANHRGNDVIVQEGREQRLLARFMYGPLDMITLSGELVDVHIMKEPPSGEWTYLSTEKTDRNGRIQYTVPKHLSLGYGIYPFKMVVRGDHTAADFYLAVVPPLTECVVFSIDGSFTASMSVSGRDPKVRAGAVDVCRHYQELGYLIIYITGRPDIQQHRVVSWLGQHNFPHGLVSFADGISTDPLGHKTAFLNNLVQNHGILIRAAYGSSKDISVYQNAGIRSDHIFIIGKMNKKMAANAVGLNDGYAAHLATLQAVGGSRPAKGNARMVIPRGCFSLPGQSTNPRRRRIESNTSMISLDESL